MTIDEAINALKKIRGRSKLGGETCLSLCLVGSGLADSNVDSIELCEDSDGAVAQVMVTHGDLIE